MHYKVSGNIIKSENAAKPYMQKSKHVFHYLKSQDKVDRSLDFGCGKLRYSDALVSMSKKVTFVDSNIQLSREQIIRGERTTVKDYVLKHYPHCNVVPYEDNESHIAEYNFITCLNVLSAIPCKKTIDSVIKNIKRLLCNNGKAVFVNQHRDSYFKKYESGEKHLYGYLYQSNNSYSYYGILCPDKTKELLIESGFLIINDWILKSINFVEAGNNR